MCQTAKVIKCACQIKVLMKKKNIKKVLMKPDQVELVLLEAAIKNWQISIDNFLKAKVQNRVVKRRVVDLSGQVLTNDDMTALRE